MIARINYILLNVIIFIILLIALYYVLMVVYRIRHKHQEEERKKCQEWLNEYYKNYPYVGNRKSKILHYYDCPACDQIPDKKQMPYKSIDDAEIDGYVMHTHCTHKTKSIYDINLS